jgi:hypothetical protein
METGRGTESVSSVVGSSQGGQMVCCCVIDVETNAAATELCVGVLLHLANCLAALSNAAAWRGLASLVLGSVACLGSWGVGQSLSQYSPLPGSSGQKRPRRILGQRLPHPPRAQARDRPQHQRSQPPPSSSVTQRSQTVRQMEQHPHTQLCRSSIRLHIDDTAAHHLPSLRRTHHGRHRLRPPSCLHRHPPTPLVQSPPSSTRPQTASHRTLSTPIRHRPTPTRSSWRLPLLHRQHRHLPHQMPRSSTLTPFKHHPLLLRHAPLFQPRCTKQGTQPHSKNNSAPPPTATPATKPT